MASKQAGSQRTEQGPGSEGPGCELHVVNTATHGGRILIGTPGLANSPHLCRVAVRIRDKVQNDTRKAPDISGDPAQGSCHHSPAPVGFLFPPAASRSPTGLSLSLTDPTLAELQRRNWSWAESQPPPARALRVALTPRAHQPL